MKINQTFKSVGELLALEPRINLNPMWQRGPVWNAERQALLIDSILREMDIPKIYLLQCVPGAPWAFEAVDGQQRLRALFTFRQDGVSVVRSRSPLPPIGDVNVNGRVYSTLPRELRDRFNNFPVCIAEIEPTDYDDIRSLFLRLQMGVTLTPAELRNSLSGPLRQVIDLMARTNEVFNLARISAARDKRQDYLAHVFTLLGRPGQTDLKAPDLLKDYEEMSADRVQELAPRVAEVLDLLGTIQPLASYRMSQKWIFVDLAWLLAERLASGKAVDAPQFAAQYVAFERRRREFTRHPEHLIAGNPKARDEALYRYINAFVASGADRTRLNARHDALAVLFADPSEAT